MPHSDFLVWLSSATLKIFISGVSIQNLVYSSSRLRKRPQNKDQLKIEVNLKNQNNLKNETDIKNDDDLKNEHNLKNKEHLKNKNI